MRLWYLYNDNIVSALTEQLTENHSLQNMFQRTEILSLFSDKKGYLSFSRSYFFQLLTIRMEKLTLRTTVENEYKWFK